MTVTPLVPDMIAAPGAELDAPRATGDFASALTAALEATGAALSRADAAERSFISGRGGLQEMVVERAQADVLLALAGAAVTRAVQALGTILGMQV